MINEHNILKNNQGVALIMTVMIMTMMFFMSSYFLNFSLTEKRISNSQSEGSKTYYLAESGVAEMISKLKDDETYQTNFEDDPNWTTEFTRNNPFGADSGSYTVSITNSSRAHGEIISTGEVDIGDGKTSKRVIRVNVYKALGETQIGDSAVFADGNVDISGGIVNFYNGSAYSNNNFIVNNGSEMYVDSDLKAAGNYIESWTASTTIVGDIYAHNYPPEPGTLSMPGIDFDSAATSSYKNMADVIYTESEFQDLIENNTDITLNGIIYVDGEVDIKTSINLTINGLLVVADEFEIDGGHSTPTINLTVNNTPGEPSGILSKDEIEFEKFIGSVSIEGLVYANDKIEIEDIGTGDVIFNVTGAMVSRKLTITSVWSPINIIHNTEIISEVLTSTEFAPLIIVDHWEEEY